MNDYIDKKDLREYIFGYIKSCNGKPTYTDMDAMDGIISLLEQMPAAEVQPVNQWISVNDRLPENCIEVLVYDTDCGIVIGWYDKEIGDFAADFISPLDAVTHWQPLPEPPKDGEHND